MLKYVQLPAVIVDIETTGGNVTYDRITEIAVIEVTESGVTEWSTLINPRMKIPPMIQQLTGITDEMVESAPYFEQVAKEILLRLKDKLFIAHNVRFDYGFIRNEFSRLALKAWPYGGPVVLIEPDQRGETAAHLLIDNWRILGVAQSEADYPDILAGENAQPLDKDIYKYLVNAIPGKASRYKIYPLPPIS